MQSAWAGPVEAPTRSVAAANNTKLRRDAAPTMLDVTKPPKMLSPQTLFTILKSRQPSCKSDGSAAVPAPAAVAQPQPNEMAPALGFGMVDELGARVAGGAVVDVLDLARLEVELDAQVGPIEYRLDGRQRSGGLVVH